MSWGLLFVVPRSYKSLGIPCSLYISGPARKVAKFYHYLERLTLASRVLLFFRQVIFQLSRTKFQTFAYNSRTVCFSYMKFWQQFEINELHVCAKFWGNMSRDFGFRTRKLPQKFGVKTGLIQKRHKYGKIFHMVLCLKTPFHPHQPTIGCDEFFFFFVFFSFFFFVNLVRSSSKPENIKIQFLCKVVELQTLF